MFDTSIYREAFNWLFQLKKDLLKAKSLEYILIIAATITTAFGLVLAILDPEIHSLSDGIWYAWVTMTHVGYGDIVPTSFLGRVLGAVLILSGLGLFALFTASLSAALIDRDIGSVKKSMKFVEYEAQSIDQEESLVLKELARLHQRLDKLEADLKNRSND